MNNGALAEIITEELKEGADIIKNGVEDLKEQNKDKDKEQEVI